jgi:hypothetical protein
MATLADLRDFCKYTGWRQTDSTGLTQLYAFINDTMQLLSDLAPWPEFQHTDGTLTFLKSVILLPVCTGDGTIVTIAKDGHGWSTGDVVTVAGNSAYYNVTDARITVIDVDSFSYPNTHNEGTESTGTATRCGDRKTLTQTRVKKLGPVFRSDSATPLTEYSENEWLTDKRILGSTGVPLRYALGRYLSSGTPLTEMYVYPEATSSTVLYFTYESYPLIMTATTDVVEWPDNRKWLLFEALKKRLAEDDRDMRGAVLYGSEFMQMVGRAFGGSRLSSRPIIMQPYTGRVTIRNCNKVITS